QVTATVASRLRRIGAHAELIAALSEIQPTEQHPSPPQTPVASEDQPKKSGEVLREQPSSSSSVMRSATSLAEDKVVDLSVLNRLRLSELQNSQIANMLAALGEKRASPSDSGNAVRTWGVDQLKSFGLSFVHLETVPNNRSNLIAEIGGSSKRD